MSAKECREGATQGKRVRDGEGEPRSRLLLLLLLLLDEHFLILLVDEGKKGSNCAVCVINRQRGLKDETLGEGLLSLLRLLLCVFSVCMYVCVFFFSQRLHC